MKTYLILIENSVYVYVISVGLILFDTTTITRKENVFAIAIQIRNICHPTVNGTVPLVPVPSGFSF